MQNWEWALLGLKLTWTLFVFAYGACVGSLINVLVYRLPLGISVIAPPSRCPSCSTRLAWRDNIPVFGWIFLRGKCRYCHTRISPEYPLVEAFTGLLFAAFYIFFYFISPKASLLGIHVGAIRPDWFVNDASWTWPTFVIILALLGSLVAATLVDAKTSTIPLAIVWVPTVVAFVGHVAHAVWLGHRPMFAAPPYQWAIPHPGATGWSWIGAAIAAMIGLAISNALLYTGLITPSFSDYQEWEESVAQSASQAGPASSGPTPEGPNPEGSPPAPPPDAAAARPEDVWIQYPHARREMIKELAFLCIPVLLAIAGFKLAPDLAARAELVVAPLWLQVLAGVSLGYLVGGGVVWAVRIFGSLAFGKEAMGLGDVHLMAAVGACLGWIDTTLAFFAAAFVGVAWAALAPLMGDRVRRAMPYGPFLAVATVLVLLAKPLFEMLLSRLLNQPIDLP
jgi:leader peptidase (prepilin peptidase)/N-methyltransferase